MLLIETAAQLERIGGSCRAYYSLAWFKRFIIRINYYVYPLSKI